MTSLRPSRCVAVAVLGAAVTWTAAGHLRAQKPPPRQSTFKAEAEMVAVDVSVLDREGRPIDDLTSADFRVLVDGQPRRITTAEFIRVTPENRAPAPSRYYSSNVNGGKGRLIMLVVDQGNISPDRVRAVAESASRFMKRLSPADRVGLVAMPAPGPQINFTANHPLIQSQLTRIAGQLAAPASQRVSIGEALRIDRGDQMALDTAIDRECAGTDRVACQQDLAAEARDVVGDARARARNSIASLRGIVERLATDATPKTIILLSEALVIDQARSDLAWLGPLAAKGRVTVHVLRIATPAADASSSRRISTRGEDVAAVEEGLSLAASLTKGSLFRVVANADNIFERLARELSGYYLLGFTPEIADRDGRPHKITIETAGRRGLEVRARHEFTVAAAKEHTSEEILAEALRAPGVLTDIPLRATAYTFPDARDNGLRILIASEVQHPANVSGSVAVAYALVGPNGEVVARGFERELKTPVREGGLQTFVATVSAKTAGVYGLKLAAVDAMGRAGSVEHAFRAQLLPAGSARVGDLLIGATFGSADGNAAPTVSGEFVDADALHAYLELNADAANVLSQTTVRFEIATREDSRALDSFPARVEPSTVSPERSAAESALAIGLLPPGDYYVRAIVSVAGKKTVQIARPFRIVRSSASAAAAKRLDGRPERAEAFSYRIDPFQRASVLTEPVVASFVEQLNAGGRRPVASEVTRLARRGELEAAAAEAKRDGHALAAPFLEGLSLYAKGDFETAAIRFREAIRADSEFFPAIFYLGACYAANGRDRDAAAAWQTSLVTDNPTPVVYVLLGDALLRQREIEAAVALMNEAAERWPEEPEVQPRRATALAMAGRPEEALQVLSRYFERHGSDRDRLFIALRLIYETRASGRSRRTLEEDRARFEEYAAAYAAAGGKQMELVERWREFLTKPGF
jgi:VWFA-related protein